MAVVRAKVHVQSYKINAWGGVSIEFAASTRGEENKVWSEATPQFSCTMLVKNQLAAEVFHARIGKDFWLDFTPIDDEAPTGS